jgi:hypothetical protein
LREIEEFIHVFYDWLEEKIHEFEEEENDLAELAVADKKYEFITFTVK